MEFFTEENLKNLVFKSPLDAYQTMKLMALQSGFEIIIQDTKGTSDCRFYCSKGGRKRGKTSNKTDCPFFFRLSTEVTNDHKLITRISPKNMCLNHNHPLLNTIVPLKLQLIEGEILDIVTNMIDSDIPPNKIRKFLYKRGIVSISTLQIRKLQMQKTGENSSIESDDLIKYIEENKGLYKIFSIRQDGVEHRLAIITFMPQEISNLQSFGDLLFVDGTQAKLNLKWEVVPITLIDSNKNIKSGGILYASILTEEIIVWMLECFLEFDFMKRKLETIITDEDAAFIVAFNRVFENKLVNTDFKVKHILCALHKAKNFKKKLISLGLTSNEIESYVDIFNSICYSTHYEQTMKNVGKLYKIKNLRSYLEKEIVPMLHMFARSCIGEAHCCGYNVSSPAESMNNMLKRGLPDRSLSLVQSRTEFNDALLNHDQIIEEITFKKRIPIDEQLYKYYFPKIAKEISIQVEMSYKIILEDDNFEYYTHKAYLNESPHLIYHLNEWHCECNLVDFGGIPCCHIIALHRMMFHEFPKFLVDPRWNKSDKINQHDEIILDDQSEDEKNDVNINLNDNETDSDISPDLPENICNETYDSNSFSALSEAERYLRLFHIAKPICSLASKNPEMSLKVGKKLTKMIEGLRGLKMTTNDESTDEFLDNFGSEKISDNDDQLIPVNISDSVEEIHSDNDSDADQIRNIENVDHVDVIRKTRGRPPKLRKSNEHSKPNKCKICLKNHLLVECPFYKDLQDLLDDEPEDIPGKNKCSLCRHFDHNIRNCPLRNRALEGDNH